MMYEFHKDNFRCVNKHVWLNAIDNDFFLIDQIVRAAKGKQTLSHSRSGSTLLLS